jgi:hypothetical protein
MRRTKMLKRILMAGVAAGTVLMGVTAGSAEVFPVSPTLHATVGDTVEYVFTADDPGTEFIVMGGSTAFLDWSYNTNPAVASGVLTQAGTFVFTIYSRDAFNATLSEREYTLTVAPQAVAKPVGRDVSLGVVAGAPLTISSSALIESIDGSFEFLWFPAQPSQGWLSSPGTDVVYTPNAGATGLDSFTYVIVASKGSGGSMEFAESDARTVTLTIDEAEETETPQPVACTGPAGENGKFVFRYRAKTLPC